ncbi:TNF receptor-associated factor 2 isoform X1 [Paramuricea clavata]|uniref:TNF receptor-associated factor 2 isoform X1 n=1 Tax=Paramuricea clavata TaxID=317549 RepID=A0A6S7JAZ5_PARCT|nr:TNF receptor-associated factor 2 isoform X1 [Paramuricea clavata]
MPGTKITDEDRQSIDAKFICTSCNLLLYIPFQTECGHLMCQSCIENLLKSLRPNICPEDGKELNEEKVFPDVFTRRQLSGLRLQCANPGCSWRGAYEQLEEHVRTSCEGAPVTCKYCKEDFLRKDIEKHERHDCNEAPATCEYEPVGCNQDKTLKRKELRQHLNDGLIEHGRLLLHNMLVFFPQLKHFITRLDFTAIINKLRDDITEIRVSLTDKFVMVVGKFNGLQARIEGIEGRLESQRDVQEAIPSQNGILLWKIEDFQRKRQDAINEVKTALYSPLFYSAQFGFKMCAKIYMNGEGFGKGSHLSLFFVVMRGDYDALQTWPFQKKITMMLLDQGNGDHMIDAFNSDPQSSSFQRPKSDMNIASGSPLFMPLDCLSDRQYIKDDVLFIKIIVN